MIRISEYQPHPGEPRLAISVNSVLWGKSNCMKSKPARKKGLFNLIRGLGPVGFAGLWQVAVVPGELDQGPVVDDVTGLRPVIGSTLRHLAIDDGPHAVVEDLGWCATQGLKRGGVAAQHRLHVLLRHGPAPQHAAAQHQREQPDDAIDAGLVGARMSSTIPVWSTARHSQCFAPAIVGTSSKCHLPPAAGSLRRTWLANTWPNFSAHWRTVSWLTIILRAASNSSTMRS